MRDDCDLKNTPPVFLKSNDLCTNLINSIDWSETDIGEIETWPQSLKTILHIILHAESPMFLLWGETRIQFFNDAFIPALSPTGNLEKELGQPAKKLLLPDSPFVKTWIEEVENKKISSVTGERQVIVYRKGAAEEVSWNCSYHPVLDEEEGIAGVFITCFELVGKTAYQRNIDDCNETKVSAIMRTHMAVSSAEERLRLATEATGTGSWDIDLRLNTIIYTPTLMELFGTDREAILTLAEINLLVHPDDVGIVEKAFTDSLISGHYHYEARIVWPDESVHWISTNGRVVYDNLNVPARLLGTTVDITDNKIEQIQKNDFIAIASHELKTPLTSIKAYLQMLKSGRGIEDPEYVVNIASRAENQVMKMTKLIYSFLDMSRIESGHVDLSFEPFMIDDLINEVIKDYLIHTNTHILNFNAGITEMIEGDRSRIGQVIDNLVSNAIKYSPLSKTIDISSTIFGDEAIVSVKDYGIGIDPKHQAKVFERFYRADDQKARNAAGFGIGLYLSADILKRHNGGIWIESDHETGTTFHFSLPLTRP